MYHKGDGFTPGKYFGCYSKAKEILGSPRFRDDLPTVAMRGKLGAKCGQWVNVYNPRTKLGTTAIRLDSGPFSCYKGKERKVLLKCPKGWKRKSIIDMTPSVARAIGHNGKEKVVVRWLSLKR